MEAVVESNPDMDRLLIDKLESEVVEIGVPCSEASIPSCEVRSRGNAPAEYLVTQWHYEGTAVRWIRELCGGWPDAQGDGGP